MAPSEVSSSGGARRYIRSSKKPKEGGDAGRPTQGDSPMPSGTASEEELYWARHSRLANVDEPDPHLHGENNNEDNRDPKRRQQQSQQQSQHRPTRKRSSTGSDFSSSTNGTGSFKLPLGRYAKAGILLSPTRDGGGGGGSIGDGSQVQSGEPLYLSPSTSNKANGQYPNYLSSNGNDLNNGHSNNNNNYNGNGNNNSGGQPQHHQFNTNGGGPPHYPYLHSFPAQPGSAYPINFYDPHGPYMITSNSTSGDGLNVRGEEVGIVLVVLLLWVGAIILFFNRWGKIRMLEPYQPKFCENHRPSCPMAEVTAISNHPSCRERAFSKFNISTEMLTGPNGSPHFVKCNYHGIPSNDPAPGFSGLSSSGMIPGGLIIPGAGFPSGGSTGRLNGHRNSIMMMNHHHQYLSRPRQNSVFVTSPSSQVSFYGSDTALKNGRKTKSAVDLPTLVLTGDFIDNVRRNSKNSITQL